MKTTKNQYYWDATCWFAWLKDERNWSDDVLLGIQHVVQEVEADKSILFASTILRTEVLQANLTPEQRKLHRGLFRRRNVVEVGADGKVMDLAARFRVSHGTKTVDAIHLATAVLYDATEFHTMDGLRNDRPNRNLLKLDGLDIMKGVRVVSPYSRIKEGELLALLDAPETTEDSESDSDVLAVPAEPGALVYETEEDELEEEEDEEEEDEEEDPKPTVERQRSVRNVEAAEEQ